MNLREARIEMLRDPDRKRRRYRESMFVRRDTRLELVALPGVSVLSDDLLPPV